MTNVNQLVNRVREAQNKSRNDTRLNALAAKLLSEPVRYGKPGLQAHVTYLASMTANVDQKIGRDAIERYEVLKKEFEGLRTEVDQVLGPAPSTVNLTPVPEGTMPLEKTVDLALKEDFCMIGSDGGIQFEPRANSHPRGAGCFAIAIRHALDIGMPLEKILEKMTSLPRRVMRLRDRGVLEEGAMADLTVFDPATIRGNATVENPNQFSSGTDLVIVNGKVAFKAGNLAAKHGVAIEA